MVPMPAARAPLSLDCAGGRPWVSLGRCGHDNTSMACPATREPSSPRQTAGPCWSANPQLAAVVQGKAVDGVGRPVTFENPPETDHPSAGSIYYLPEVVKWISHKGIEYAGFNTVYADPDKGEKAYKKPQRFVGRLPGLGRLSATCRCPKHVGHRSVVAEAAKDSASYPSALCRAYAKLLVAAWKASAPAGAAAAATEAPTLKRKAPAAGEASETILEATWQGGAGKFASLQAQDSKKAKRDRENKEAIGGMRRPVRSLEKVPGLRAVGMETDLLFDKSAERVPGAAEASEGYGTEGFVIKHWASGGRSWKHISA